MAFADMTINDFVDQLGSKAPVPGGGGAAGLVGAVGAALGQMVCSLTTGKKKYAEYEEEICELIEITTNLRHELLALVDADAEAFEPLSKAYGIPKEDPTRAEVMENALKGAVAAPEQTMKVLCECLDRIDRIAQIGSRLAISDAGVAALCCKTALQSAALNIYINTGSIADRAFAEDLDARTDAMLAKYCPFADKIYENVLAAIRG